jgi:hypothetical protein
MSSTATASNTTAPPQILQVSGHSYAYRRFVNSSGLPLLCLQHFQYPESFTRHAAAFLSSDSESAVV